MKATRKQFIAAAALVAAIGFFFLFRDHEEAQVPVRAIRPVKTVVVGIGEGGTMRTFPARVQANQKVDLSFRVSGPLVELPATKGKAVGEGELLARIDPRDYEIRLANTKSALENAQAQLAAMKAGARKEDVAVLQAQLSAARAQLAEAQAQYNRYEALYRDGAVSAVEYDRVKTSYQVAKAQVDQATQDLHKGQAGARPEDIRAMESTIRGLQSQVDAAEAALKDTELRAPFQGLIGDRYVDNYQTVQANQPIVTLQDLDAIELVIALPERDLARARSIPDPRIRARFDSLPGRTFALALKEVATQADAQTQAYAVTFVMPKPGELTLLPGMTAEVLIDLEGGAADTTLFALPPSALMAEEGERQSVWKVDALTLTVRRTAVAVKGYKEESVLVEGLQAGDRIVTAGVTLLSEGDEVTLLQDSR